MSHDYHSIAARILAAVGGRDNLQQAAHCITRLRLSLKDDSRGTWRPCARWT